MFCLGLLGVCWPSGLFHLVCLPFVFLPSLRHKRVVAVVRIFLLLYVCLRMPALETVFSQQYITARCHDDSCYAELLQMHRLSPDLACSHVRTHNHHPLASFISGEESYTPKVTMRVDAFAAVGSQMSPRLPPCRPFLLAEGEGDRLVALQIYFLHRRRMM